LSEAFFSITIDAGRDGIHGNHGTRALVARVLLADAVHVLLRSSCVSDVDVKLHLHFARAKADHGSANAIAFVNFGEDTFHNVSGADRFGALCGALRYVACFLKIADKAIGHEVDDVLGLLLGIACAVTSRATNGTITVQRAAAAAGTFIGRDILRVELEVYDVDCFRFIGTRLLCRSNRGTRHDEN